MDKDFVLTVSKKVRQNTKKGLTKAEQCVIIDTTKGESRTYLKGLKIMYRLKDETAERLISRAKKYSEFELFSAELGWEDWMEDFTEAEEGEEFTEAEGMEIDGILKEIFRKAHEEMNYKNFEKIYIGDSDIASLVLRTPTKVDILKFGGDSSYYAYECFGEVEIGEHYSKVFSGETWLKIYDDEGLSYSHSEYNGKYKSFDIYRAGEYGCIIHWHE